MQILAGLSYGSKSKFGAFDVDGPSGMPTVNGTWTSANLLLGEQASMTLDLRNVRGLETIRHTGPSTIGSNTIYRSKGEIPEGFLRGCGVPDELITFAQSMRTCTIRYYSCFISHSSKDKAFAAVVCRLAGERRTVLVCSARHQRRAKIREQVDEAIRSA